MNRIKYPHRSMFNYSSWSLLILVFLCTSVFSAMAQNSNFNFPSNCGLNINIPDNSCPTGISTSILVNGLTNSQLGSDIYLEEVRLIIKHTWDADVWISLVSPNGVEVALSNENGNAENHYGNPADMTCSEVTSFSVAACQNIQDGDAPFIGAYAPQESFYTFNDGSDANGNWQLRICDDTPDDVGVLEYVELIFSTMPCLPPIQTEVSNIDSTTISLNWESGNNCQNTIIEYGVPGFTPGLDANAGEGTVVLAACPPYDLMALASNSLYDIYIREQCDGTNFSANSCVLTAQTLCNLPLSRLTESFDNQLICSDNCGDTCVITGTWTNIQGDDFDWLTHQGTTTTPLTGPTTDIGGTGNYIYLESSSNACRNGNEAQLVSNCLQIETGGSIDCHLSFFYHMYGGDIGALRLDISVDGGISWTNIWSKTGPQGNQWLKQYINLQAYQGEIVKFRFVGQGGPNQTGDIAIDNITFYETIDLGEGDFTFYRDSDGDGFGDSNFTLNTCDTIISNLYVTNNLDCNDTDENINPMSPESPCNNIDENCNGNADDMALQAPIVRDTTLCNSPVINIVATPIEAQADWVFWYNAPTGFDIVAPPDFLLEGVPYTPSVNTTGEIITDTLYAEAQDFDITGCISQPRAMMLVHVAPFPKLRFDETPEICSGQLFDLQSLNIIDEHGLDGNLTYHTASPADENNQLPSSIVSPMDTITYIIKSSTETGCSDEIPVTLNVRPGTSVSISPESPHSLCTNTRDTLFLDIAGNSQDYTIRWSTNDTMITQLPISSNPMVGATDMYSVTVTDVEGCQSTDTIAVTTVVSIPSIQVEAAPVTICNGSDGAINIQPNGGMPSFNYQLGGTQTANINGADGAISFENLTQGTYSVTVTDASEAGCPIFFRNIVLNGPDAQIAIDQIDTVTCHGAADGEICLSVTGDDPQILWENGDMTACTDSLSAGTYQVTVTDNNCSDVLSIELSEPEPLSISQNVSLPSCSNVGDGEIDISVNGGTAPYGYQWSNGRTTEDISNLAAGDYIVTITDANNCSWTADTIFLDAPDVLTINLDTIHHVSCHNADDGQIFISASGGTAPYTYDWTTGASSEDISNLGGGVYNVVAIDANGCSMAASFSVNNPEPIELFANIIDASCPGADDGGIATTILGGTTATDTFRVTWTGGDFGIAAADLEDATAGAYEVVILDDNNCRLDSSFTINAPEALDFSANVQLPHCVGGTDGQIDLMINEPVNSIFWTPTGNNTPSLSNIGAGTYEVDIIAANGCSFDTTIVIAEEQLEQVIQVSETLINPSCAEIKNGAINLFMFPGGEAPFTFEWNTGADSQNLTNLGGGFYYNTIRDVDGCTFTTDTFFLDEPERLEIIAEDITTINCFGERSGGVDFSITGGVQPYEYILNDEVLASQQTLRNELTDVPAGQYYVLIRDANSCLDTLDIVLNQPPLLEIESIINGDTECDNETGIIESLEVTIIGGVEPYQVDWNTGDTIPVLIQASPDLYAVTVTDANNCRKIIEDIKVPEVALPLVLDTVLVDNIDCYNGENGSVTISFSGGSLPYEYIWGPPLGTEGSTRDTFIHTGNVLDFSTNGYNVTITDSRGCQLETESYFPTQPTPIFLNLAPDSIIVPPCDGSLFGQIMPTISGGEPPYTFSLYQVNTGTFIEPVNFDEVYPGAYILSAVDAIGCPVLDDVMFSMPEQDNSIEAETIVIPVLCFGDSTGRIDITVEGGIEPISFQWSTGQTGSFIRKLAAGEYSVTIEDGNPCRRIINNIVVPGPTEDFILENTLIEHATCAGEASGSIELFMKGGQPPYAYFWTHSNAQTTALAEDLEADHYDIFVTDDNGCMADLISIELTEPEPVMVDFSILNASTDTSQNGSATVNIYGGISPYQVWWEDGSVGDSFLNKPSGTYTLSITDENNCVLDTFVVISATIVGTEQIDKEAAANWTLAPNPTSQQSILDIQLERRATIQLDIWNMLGQQLYVVEEADVLAETYVLPLSGFAAGVYLVSLKVDGVLVGLEKLVIR